MKHQRQAFAILRVDSFLGDDVPIIDKVTVKEIVWTQQIAELEVRRLNEINSEKGSFYFWQATRVMPEDE